MSGGSARSLGKGEACLPRFAATLRRVSRPGPGGWAAPERSHAGGSAPPGQVPEGLIRVYSMRFCPFAKRTLLVLKAKGIGHEVININLKNKPEWFFKKNPFGLVPVLENSQGQVIYESAITCEYLDEAYPGKKLLPDDPYEKACQKMVFELFSKVPPLLLSFLRRQNKEDCSGLKEELHKEFSKLEEVLTNKKTTFFGGSSLSMIDYLIWPWFEWLVALELNEYVNHTPNLKLWMEAMMKDPAVSSLFIDPKAFRGFLDLYLQNNLEACDYGL
ncbi:glutathione S-transferase omega-1 isoform X1 [Tursiops truncatus]|uniref:Glutathione S-transferase omega n=1 Tax=Tursiops truncatus TaxID=9739 RepID=A0A6J3Q5Q7_TURTR|nr:glutathione S-transferase omega-1 isoform X1 [Tursiops truncatus]